MLTLAEAKALKSLIAERSSGTLETFSPAMSGGNIGYHTVIDLGKLYTAIDAFTEDKES